MATMKSSIQGRAAGVNSSPQPEIFRLRPISERGGPPVKVHTSRTPLSAKEQRALDELAKLFTVQEERCLSEASREQESSELSRETSQLSKVSMTSSRMAADATFIYQHINYEVLSKCVPVFVKSHLNRNGRYLPETFILRVNYWRRRRMIGDESASKKAKKEKVVRTCTEQVTPSSKPPNATPRPSTVASSSKQTTISG